MMGYDEFGHMVYQKLGNGAETIYAYDKERQRLQEMNLSTAGSQMMQNRYEYDKVDNILSLVNNVNPQNLTERNSAKLGGTSRHTYQYDGLNRLIQANGTAKNASYSMAMTFNNMSMPTSKVQTVDSTETAQSYHNTYLYDDRNHPTAPTQIGNERYEYDANGNPVLVTNDSTQQTRELYWDEENRLMVLSDNGKTSRYTYNHAGVRIVKSHGDLEGVYINGAPQGITFHEHDDFTLYPASIISVNKNRFTKHYFIGSQRIASKLGSGRFNNVYGRNGSYVTAGQQDYVERLNQIEQQREEYYKDLGIAPGVPTMKGAYGDPENTGIGYNTIITELGDHSVPKNWEQYVVKREPGETPGPPIIWSDPQDPEDAQPGYGFIADDTNEEETFFYHSDHLGSTSYITDDKGNITQYTAYLPYGELLVDEHSSSEDLPYKFNGKELDEETGLYYYGARYMNPVASIWCGVDPLTEKYPNVSGYVYCGNNPVRYIDPTGMFYGDYYDKNGLYLGNDGKNDGKVYLASGKGENGFTDVVDLNISYNSFVKQSSTVYGESSAYKVRNKKSEPSEDLQHEMFAIASVHQRNKKAYGVNSQQAQIFREKSDEERNHLPLMRTAIAAEINALRGGFDYSYGATAWDGAEQAMFAADDKRKSTGKFELHMNTGGWNIKPEHYVKWKNNVGEAFKAPMIRIAPEYLYDKNYNRIPKPNMNAGKTRYHSTAVYGSTIFWKITK